MESVKGEKNKFDPEVKLKPFFWKYFNTLSPFMILIFSIY